MNPAFHLLRPTALPRERLALTLSGVGAASLSLMEALTPASTDAEAAVLVRRALQLLETELGPFHPIMGDPDESESNRSNDQAFGIVRVDGEASPLLLHSALSGFVALLDEAIAGGTGLDAPAWGHLRGLFWVLLGLFGQRDLASEQPLPTTPPARAAQPEDRNAHRRWVVGHRIFMVTIQGLVVTMSCLRQELADRSLTSARRFLTGTVRLMRGAAAALRFAGDFSYTDYEREVRPTLMPPAAPPGMSGLHWRDHEHLLQVLVECRPALMAMDESLLDEYAALIEALAQTYDAHKYVCSGFVGHERKSLLVTTPGSKSAVEMLEHFKNVRLRLLIKKGNQ